jgi:hypothetical protein
MWARRSDARYSSDSFSLLFVNFCYLHNHLFSALTSPNCVLEVGLDSGCVFFFFCGFLNYTVNGTEYMAPNCRMINEFHGIWKKMVVVYFEVLCRHLPGGAVEFHEQPLSELLVPRPMFETRTSRIDRFFSPL